MFPLGIVHSVIHTLLLALSASGRSAYPHGAYLHEYPHEYLFADPKMSIAFALPQVQNTSAHGEQLAGESPSIRIVVVPLAHEYMCAVLLPNTPTKSAWTLDVSRRNAFLGMPAERVLLRQHFGTSTTKIRKIFTVRKNTIANDDMSRWCSAPPDDEDSLPDVM
jgi:hypothetical protein